MEIRQILLTSNSCYKQGSRMTPKGIVVHSTGANNPYISRYVAPDDGVIGANKYNNHWNQPGINKCVHAFIGKDKNGNVRIYQTLPWDYKPWGCGSGPKGSFNNSHIQFEICEDGLNDKDYFEKAFSAAVFLCKFLIAEYGISVNNVVSHYEAHNLGYASNHGDPHTWLKNFGKSMDWFRSQLTIPSPQPSSSDVGTCWNVYADGKWVESVGIDNIPIRALTIKTTKGTPRYRVHRKGQQPWDDFVTSFGWTKGGYAGNGRDEIDGIQMEIRGIPGYNIMYRVSLVGKSDWLPWVVNYSDSDEGYAGIIGKAIDKIEIKVVRK